MERDFIYRQTLVWLEHEFTEMIDGGLTSYMTGKDLAESLTSHLVNNWRQIEKAQENWRARAEKAESQVEGLLIIMREAQPHLGDEYQREWPTDEKFDSLLERYTAAIE